MSPSSAVGQYSNSCMCIHLTSMSCDNGRTYSVATKTEVDISRSTDVFFVIITLQRFTSVVCKLLETLIRDHAHGGIPCKT